MKCIDCFYLTTIGNKNFCYNKLKVVEESCKNFKEKSCKNCDFKIKNKCSLNNKNYPNVCGYFKRVKQWDLKFKEKI